MANLRNIRQIQLPTSELCETCRTSLKKLRDTRLKSHPIRPNFETFACLSSPRPETSKHSSKKCAVRANYRDVRQKWIFRKIVRDQPWQGSRAERISKIFEKSSALKVHLLQWSGPRQVGCHLRVVLENLSTHATF